MESGAVCAGCRGAGTQETQGVGRPQDRPVDQEGTGRRGSASPSHDGDSAAETGAMGAVRGCHRSSGVTVHQTMRTKLGAECSSCCSQLSDVHTAHAFLHKQRDLNGQPASEEKGTLLFHGYSCEAACCGGSTRFSALTVALGQFWRLTPDAVCRRKTLWSPS